MEVLLWVLGYFFIGILFIPLTALFIQRWDGTKIEYFDDEDTRTVVFGAVCWPCIVLVASVAGVFIVFGWVVDSITGVLKRYVKFVLDFIFKKDNND